MPVVEPHGPDDQPHAPAQSLWPVGFAIGIAVLLTGIILNWIVVAIGAAVTVVFGFLWARDVAAGPHVPAPPPGPDQLRPGAAPAVPPEPALPLATEEEIERFPRSRFLEGATLGIGGIIGGLVTVPAVGFAVVPTFVGQEPEEVDIGPLGAFPVDEWRVVTFMENPEEGEVTRRTAFVRYNGLLDGRPSFTIISNRCAHLGCPTQPSGPIDDEAAERERTSTTPVVRIPVQPSGFSCPCHGGAYDEEGNRTAGPPVRALDRYEYAIKNGNVFLRSTYSVGEVRGEGKEAIIVKYGITNPGIHVDGPEEYFYPVNVPR